MTMLLREYEFEQFFSDTCVSQTPRNNFFQAYPLFDSIYVCMFVCRFLKSYAVQPRAFKFWHVIPHVIPNNVFFNVSKIDLEGGDFPLIFEIALFFNCLLEVVGTQIKLHINLL